MLDSCLLYFSPFYALFQWTTTLLLHSAQRHAHCSVLCTALLSYNSLKSLLLLESSTVLSQHCHSQSTQPLHRVSTLSLSLSLFFFPFPKLHDVSFCLCRWRRWFYRGFFFLLLLFSVVNLSFFFNEFDCFVGDWQQREHVNREICKVEDWKHLVEEVGFRVIYDR